MIINFVLVATLFNINFQIAFRSKSDAKKLESILLFNLLPSYVFNNFTIIYCTDKHENRPKNHRIIRGKHSTG